MLLVVLLVGCLREEPQVEPLRTVVVHVQRAPVVTLRIPGPPSAQCVFEDGSPPLYTDEAGYGYRSFIPESYPISTEFVMWCAGDDPVLVKVVEIVDA